VLQQEEMSSWLLYSLNQVSDHRVTLIPCCHAHAIGRLPEETVHRIIRPQHIPLHYLHGLHTPTLRMLTCLETVRAPGARKVFLECCDPWSG